MVHFDEVRLPPSNRTRVLCPRVRHYCRVTPHPVLFDNRAHQDAPPPVADAGSTVLSRMLLAGLWGWGVGEGWGAGVDWRRSDWRLIPGGARSQPPRAAGTPPSHRLLLPILKRKKGIREVEDRRFRINTRLPLLSALAPLRDPLKHLSPIAAADKGRKRPDGLGKLPSMFTRFFAAHSKQQQQHQQQQQQQQQQQKPGKPDDGRTDRDQKPKIAKPVPAASSQLSQLDKAAVRVLVCQDTGDKSKLPLFDTLTEPAAANPRIGSVSPLRGSEGGIPLPRQTQPLPMSRSRNYSRGSSTTTPVGSFDEAGLGIGGARARGLVGSNGPGDTARGPQGLRRKFGNNFDLLGEMIFGAVPLTSKGVTTKVHYFRSPQAQVLVTKLFTLAFHPDADDDSGTPAGSDDDSSAFSTLIERTERRARSASISSFQSQWSDAYSDAGDGYGPRPPSRIGSSYSRSYQSGAGSFFPQSGAAGGGRPRPTSWVSIEGAAQSRRTLSSSPTPSLALAMASFADCGGGGPVSEEEGGEVQFERCRWGGEELGEFGS
ncbi:hypothetical protein BDK51DRAFT_52851 [Blyttiomyces helicus]|uniref:Folliculin-interacting protein N-terminal domain-containing protein n=1 Tax=Blyttiomyces helicus TaxID=388810 RepID=A0A4V1IQG4_9FUNG|nr:hypothetical protein BDK51DRAFT_52851 [Blyttiomyces helicus]|eukprot:RKO86467.1 hypothetical protein BDK51DRAFT_52851 [Blyttiomyces helicus]